MNTFCALILLSAISVGDWAAFAADAAIACVAAGKTPELAPAKKCCDECKGTGSITSGDGLAKFDCACDALCACKGKAAPAVSVLCKDGKCAKPASAAPAKKTPTSSGVRRWRR